MQMEKSIPKPRRVEIQMPGLLTEIFLEEFGGGDDPDHQYDLPTKVVAVDGTELNYFELGQGEPVVFVHGSIGDYRTWGYQFEAFAARHRVVSYSRRFHYPNEWPRDGREYTTALHAEDLASLLRHLDHPRVHLVGQSTGAVVAAHVARDHPDLVRTLSVCEPAFLPWLAEIVGGTEQLNEFIRTVRDPGARHMFAGDPDTAVEAFCDGVLGTGTFADLAAEKRRIMLDNGAELRAELEATAMYSPFTFDDARGLQMPTLLIRGGNSLPLFDLLSVKFEELVPDIEVQISSEANHAVQYHTPDSFNRMVLDFLYRHRSG